VEEGKRSGPKHKGKKNHKKVRIAEQKQILIESLKETLRYDPLRRLSPSANKTILWVCGNFSGPGWQFFIKPRFLGGRQNPIVFGGR
jgi:hypothetical protein